MALAVCGGICYSRIQAAPVLIEITGEITHLEGAGLPDTIRKGDAFTGSYCYESSTLDSNPVDEIGEYRHNAPYGINIALGGYELKTLPTHDDQFVVSLVLPPYANRDYYNVISSQNISQPAGLAVKNISWIIGDSSQSALDSANLPVGAPNLNQWDYNLFEISGENNAFKINGQVTQATLIPEPAACTLMIMAGFFLSQRKH